MSSTLQLLVLLLILVLLFIWKRYRRLTLLQRYGIKGPVEHAKWLTGNALEMIESPPKKIDQWIKEYGKVFGMYDFAPVIVIADADFLKQIQVRDFHLFPNRRTIIQEGGFDANPEYEVHITSSDIPSDRWKEQRSLIATAFTTSKLKASVPLINDAADVLLQNIADRESQPDFEIYDLFQRFTMDTIGSSAFGISLNCQKNPQNPMFIATKKFFDDFTKDWTQLPLYLSFMFPEFFHILYPIRRIQRKLMLWLGYPSHWTYQIEVCRQIVEQRKQRFNEKDSSQREDLLQQMIEASLTSDQMNSMRESNLAATDCTDDGLSFTTGHQVQQQQHQSSKGKVHRMTDQEIIGNASILFDAGYETTSTLLGFLTHVLVNRHDIQDRIREEVNQMYARDQRLDYNVMQSLPFLDSVIYETLRLYPPILGAVTRQSTVEYEFKGYRIPPDTAVFCPLWSMHRDPDFWEKPDEFDPLRFYGENKSRASSPYFQVFGYGPRNCIGLRFALLEAKLVVARILHKYRLVPGPHTESFEEIEIHWKPFNIAPKKGVYVKVVPV